jgi:primosomal protein N' (replication factor Y)
MRDIVEVAVGLPIHKTFHYRIPEKMKDSLQVGMRVLVPFKGRKVAGFTLDLPERPPEGIASSLLDVEDLLDQLPLIDAGMLRFYRWISDYYIYPLGEVIKTGLPPGLHLKSEPVLTLTDEGILFLTRGRLDGIQENAFREIRKHGTLPLTRLLKRFPEELTREKVFSWGKHGFLDVEEGMRRKEVKPKLEKVIEVTGERPGKLLSGKRNKILEWMQKQEKVPYSELTKTFKSSSAALHSLQAAGLIRIFLREVSRDLSVRSDLKPYSRPDLTRDQEAVLAEVSKGIHSKRFSPFLIHGVTASGKTEIYLRAIEAVLAQGRQAILLVPEISLTPQLLSRFQDRFGKNLALLHSGLGKGERFDQWRKIRKGDVSIAIGARSAVFAPFQRLGIIIVDEEHDPSYKQEEKLKYHARDLAVVRAKQAEATLLLGSATPSLESYDNAEKGRFHLLHLPERVEGKRLPDVDVLDIRKEPGLFSEKMKTALQKNIEEKKQSLLFLNRRGFASFILCPDCGFTYKCPNCSVTLTYHLKDRSLRCHYCDYQIPAPADCPQCQGHQLRRMGIGTERLEDEIRALFPGAQVERMDRDTTTRKHSHHHILKRFESGRIDILVGTQMIVKGHDFPGVTLVGVISADTSLHFPDFRSSERTFQLLTQVAGRAGRGASAGRVIIQTFNPDHYSILRAKEHDFPGFYREEIQFRKALDYPPFCRLINFRLSGNSEKKTERAAEEMGTIGRFLLKKGYGKGIQILGPSVAPFAKVRGKYRWQMLLKGKSSSLLHRFGRDLAGRLEPQTKGRGVSLDIDVDPVSIL